MSPSKKARAFCSRENRKSILHRVRSSVPSTIAELVYGFLGNVAILEAERTARKFKCDRVRVSRIGKPRCRRRRSCESKGTTQEPTDSKIKFTPDLCQVPTKTKDSQAVAKSNAKDVVSKDREKTAASKKKTVDSKILLKSRSLAQVINNYIRAGLREGKRRAKRYMCKALSFGLDSGYLIPADQEGQVLRVSSTLIDFKFECEKDDVDGRMRRRSLRRGKRSCCSQDRRKLRRRDSAAWDLSCRRRQFEKTIQKRNDKFITNDRQSRSGSDKKKSVTRLVSRGRKVKRERAMRKLKKSRSKKGRRSGSRSASKNNRGSLSSSPSDNADVPTNSTEKPKTVDVKDNVKEMEINEEI